MRSSKGNRPWGRPFSTSSFEMVSAMALKLVLPHEIVDSGSRQCTHDSPYLGVLAALEHREFAQSSSTSTMIYVHGWSLKDYRIQ
jgi:hypothetical protein